MFSSPESELEKFTQKHSKKKSIASIPRKDLERWKALMGKTNGEFLPKVMSPKLWSDSIESLQTAISVLIMYLPQSVASSEVGIKAIVALRSKALREIKAKHEREHGKGSLRV